MLNSKDFIFVLMPAFLLAQLLCICSSARAITARETLSIAPASKADHACCTNLEKTQTPQEHKAGCPHCGEQTTPSPAPDRTTAPVAELTQSPFDLLCPLPISAATSLSIARRQAYAQWLADPAPPLDLLRGKCTLLI
ncbi:MAG TPA: hypothetical protein VGB55_09470 [Tepidisphaeraceae bacterium]